MAYTTPKTWDVAEELTAAKMNEQLRDNILALKNPPSGQAVYDSGSNYSTTSTSFVPVDSTNLAVTLTTTGGDVWVWFNCVLGNVFGYLDIDVDGTAWVSNLGNVDGLGRTLNSVQLQWSGGLLITGLSAGSHTFKLAWKSAGGTLILYNGGTAGLDAAVVFGAREI